jgi:hypothetical protein
MVFPYLKGFYIIKWWFSIFHINYCCILYSGLWCLTDVEEEEHYFLKILEVNDEIKLAIPPKGTGTWKIGFSNTKYDLIFSK